MNRNIEWEKFLREVKSSIPTQLEFSVENALLRKRNRKRKALFITTNITGILIALVSFKIYCSRHTPKILCKGLKV